MADKEWCVTCPIKGEIELYIRAGNDGDLALRLATEQGIVSHRPDVVDLQAHFAKTAQMVSVVCKSERLCEGLRRKRGIEQNTAPKPLRAA